MEISNRPRPRGGVQIHGGGGYKVTLVSGARRVPRDARCTVSTRPSTCDLPGNMLGLHVRSSANAATAKERTGILDRRDEAEDVRYMEP